jgi:hypothetical protein
MGETAAAVAVGPAVVMRSSLTLTVIPPREGRRAWQAGDCHVYLAASFSKDYRHPGREGLSRPAPTGTRARTGEEGQRETAHAASLSRSHPDHKNQMKELP